MHCATRHFCQVKIFFLCQYEEIDKGEKGAYYGDDFMSQLIGLLEFLKPSVGSCDSASFQCTE